MKGTVLFVPIAICSSIKQSIAPYAQVHSRPSIDDFTSLRHWYRAWRQNGRYSWTVLFTYALLAKIHVHNSRQLRACCQDIRPIMVKHTSYFAVDRNWTNLSRDQADFIWNFMLNCSSQKRNQIKWTSQKFTMRAIRLISYWKTKFNIVSKSYLHVTFKLLSHLMAFSGGFQPSI